MPVDVLAIAAHRDDVELTCAGTLVRAIDAGHRTGILDLTAGESATRGNAGRGPRRRSGPPRFWASPSGGTPACRMRICRIARRPGGS